MSGVSVHIEGFEPIVEFINDILDPESAERRWLRNVSIRKASTPSAGLPDRPGWVVSFQEGERISYLRWSKGPIQGFFWDTYPEVFGRLGWAVRSLVTAPSPIYFTTKKDDSDDGSR